MLNQHSKCNVIYTKINSSIIFIYQCLKCGMVFLNRSHSEEYYECPDTSCRSRMVIEKITNEIDVDDDESDDDGVDGVGSDTEAVVGGCGDCNKSHSEEDSQHAQDSSFAIVIPSFKDSVNSEGSTVSSWPPCCQRNLL